MGAVVLSAYQIGFPVLLNQMSKEYSGGSYQFVIHGITYSYNFTNTTVSRRILLIATNTGYYYANTQNCVVPRLHKVRLPLLRFTFLPPASVVEWLLRCLSIYLA